MLALHRAFPEAPIHTTLFDPGQTYPEFAELDVHPSPLNRVSGLRSNHRRAMPLLAWASERILVRARHTIVSSSGWAHGFRTTGSKIVYCYSPARWLYQPDTYLGTTKRTLVRRGLDALSPALRRWDRRQASTATTYFAISTVVQQRIRDAYGIEAEVLPAPHSVDADAPQEPVDLAGLDIRDGFYLCISRLLPYKNVHVVMEAFEQLDLPLVVVGRGPEERRLASMASPRVRMLKDLTDAQMRWLYAHCTAVVAASFEDFGLTPIEAASFGKPAVVLRWGGFLDTIREDETGTYFDEPTPEAVAEAVVRSRTLSWDIDQIREHAGSFSEERFANRLRAEMARIDREPAPPRAHDVAATPTRVVFVDHSSEPGGAELALLRTVRTSQSWKATIVVPSTPQSLDRDLFASLPDAISIQRIGPEQTARATTGKGAFANLRLTRRILAAAASLASSRSVRAADILIANTTRASVYVTIAGALLRIPVVVHVRDLVEPQAIGGAATRLMRSFVLPRASAVIANSRASLDLVAPYVADDAITEVIPSPAGLAPAPSTPVRIAPRVRRIGMIARLDPWKGQELLLRAFAQAHGEGEQRLVLFGGAAFGHEPHARELKRLAGALGVGDRVEFPGHVEDVAGALESLDVCVQFSVRAEPLGQNVLQYLAAARPTIVADEGGPAEWVRDGVNGLVVPARNVEALATALRRIGDPALRETLATGARATQGLLDDQQVGDRIAALAERVVRR